MTTRTIAAALLLLGTGCVSTTTIHTDPEGATVRSVITGDAVGQTPYVLRTRKPMMAGFSFTLERPGYFPSAVTVQREHWSSTRDAVLTAVFCAPIFPWSAKFEKSYTVTLVPIRSRASAPDAGD